MTTRRRAGEDPIETWAEMKAVMRKRYVPSHYYRELHQKLQRMRQGNRTVEEYFRDMEIAMIRANIEESRDATLARFLAGLNPDIADLVELQHYVELEELVHLSIKIEKQLKTRGSSRRYTEQPTWKRSHASGDRSQFKPRMEMPKPSTSVNTITPHEISSSSKKPEAPTPRNRDIKCFKCQGLGHIANQCPNKRSMTVLASGEVVPDDEGVKGDHKDDIDE